MDYYIWNVNTWKVENKSKKMVIIANNITGEWIRITTEVYQSIDILIKKRILKSEIRKMFKNQKSYEYTLERLQLLERLEIIMPSKKSKVYKWKLQDLSILVTDDCNLRCKHCSGGFSQKHTEKKNILNIYDIIDKVVIANPEQIVFTGGEPLLHPDLPEILSYTR